jgi:hypothetical protein
MSIATDGFGTIISGLETGGGGGSVIPDNGNITGVYDGNLVCDGNVNVTGNLEVKGSMLVRGDFVNDGGHQVIIRGDLFAQSILFDHVDTSQPQSNFQVDGDLIFTFMNFRQSGGFQAQLRVGGDLTGSSGFSGTILNGNGVDGSLGVQGTDGLNLVVYGDLTVSDVSLYGGDNLAGSAGSGGNVTVYGDCAVTTDLNLSGGNATDGDAGLGGYLYVYGDVSIPGGTLSVRGGSSSNGNAGNAGTVEIEGNFTGSEISAYGGDCTSDSELHRSGSGGDIFVYGQVTWSGLLNVSGGDRYGTLLMGAFNTAPDAGTIDVNGGLFASDLYARGGGVFTNGFAPHEAGNGGYLFVEGTLSVNDDLQFEGGDANQGNAGSGGVIDVEGYATIEDDFNMNGGDSQNGNGGNGGSAYFYSDLIIDECRMYGGNSVNGNGGYGASLFVKGNLTCNEFYSAYGGNCSSIVEFHQAGHGGNINIEGNFTYFGEDDDIYMDGGERTGLTTVSSLGTGQSNGGYINVGGSFICCSSIYLRGGDVYTDYPNAPGGEGGSCTVKGTLVVTDDIFLDGGRSVGNTGGNGGNLDVYGHSKVRSIYSVGGDSVESILTGDASTAGNGGSLTFRAGVTSDTISQIDGIFGLGGSAPSGQVDLSLGGACIVHQIDMSSRMNCYIRQYQLSSIPVTLKVNSVITKNTLNDSAGTATGDISALTDGSLFFTGAGGVWYSVPGVLVP